MQKSIYFNIVDGLTEGREEEGMNFVTAWSIFQGIAPVLSICMGVSFILLEVFLHPFQNRLSKKFTPGLLICAAILCSLSFIMLYIQWRVDNAELVRQLSTQKTCCEQAERCKEKITEAAIQLQKEMEKGYDCDIIGIGGRGCD